MNNLRNIMCALACTVLVSAISSTYAGDNDDGDRHHGDHHFKIDVLSSRPYMVSGGDALVRVTVKKKDVSLGSVRIELNGANITDAFQADARTLTGLVTGLRLGENELAVDAKDKSKGKGRADADITLTNYPIQGPIISGPHEFPFACTTETFVPFPGSPALGAPLDSDCSVERRVQYVYRTTGNAFNSLPQPYSSLPADLAFTTTVTGATVPYIVRLETGTINRAIYQTAILHNPNDAAPSPFAPPAGWNKRLIYPLGGGCIGGWYTQGPDLVDPVNHSYLSQGYGVASATLNTFGNNCNDLLSSETILMVKERFIESFGVPLFTIGTGSSGGAYQSNQTADNYPGAFDGIVTMNSFPDVTTGMVPMHSSLGGGNGLARAAIITRMGGNDLLVQGDVHLRYHSFSIRQRLINANGHADNQVIVGNLAPSDLLIEQMGRWLAAVVSDTSARTLAEKVVANKPADVVDACWTTAGVKIVEPQTLNGPGQCNTLFPAGVPPEFVAGAPIELDVIKCKLKPIDMRDYAVPFTAQQRAQLKAIFPHGVCDWSERGVQQVKSVPWASYGPSPHNLIFDVTQP
jgi:Tannase-like family of unknown function (DUF6351)